MADLRVKSTGKEFRRVDNATALVLEEMFPGDLERINAPARASEPTHQHNPVNQQIPFYPTPTWDVEMVSNAVDTNIKYFCITLGTGRSRYVYPGSPDGAVPHFGRIGFKIPDNILDRYRRLYKHNGPVNLGDARIGSDANRKAANELDAKKHQLKEAAIDRESQPVADTSGTFGIAPATLPEFPRKDADGKYL